ITQQYVKNAYLSQEQTAGHKFTEMLYAYRLQQLYSKDEILTRYLNSNYYGRGAYGIDDASKTWFGVSATRLKDMNSPLQLARAAMLAALINEPSSFAEPVPGHPDQLVHQAELDARTNYVLDGLDKVQGVSTLVPASKVAQAKQLLPLKVTGTTSL